MVKRVFLLAACVFSLCLALAGCSTPGQNVPAEKTLPGVWDVYTIDGHDKAALMTTTSEALEGESASSSSSSSSSASNGLSEEDKTRLSLLATTTSLSFMEDKSGSLYCDGLSYTLTWEPSGNKATIKATQLGGEGGGEETVEAVLTSQADGVVELSATWQDHKYVFRENAATANASPEAPPTPPEQSTSESTEPAEPAQVYEERVEPIQEVVIADDGICRIAVNAKRLDTTGDFGYNLVVTNKTGNKIVLRSVNDSFKAGDKTLLAILNAMPAPGATLNNVFLSFDREELGISEIADLKGIEGKLVVRNYDTFEDLATYDFRMQ